MSAKLTKYKGKQVKITLKDKDNKEIKIESIVRNEFSFKKKSYYVVRVGLEKYLKCITESNAFLTSGLRYLNITNIQIEDSNFEDKDFSWLNMPNMGFRLYIDHNLIVNSIDILFKCNANDTVTFIYVTADRLSKIALHKIMINL